MSSVVKRLAGESTGASMVEYGLLLGLIALSLVIATSSFGAGVSGFYQRAAAGFPQSVEPGGSDGGGGSTRPGDADGWNGTGNWGQQP